MAAATGKHLIYGYYTGGATPVAVPLKVIADGTLSLAASITLDPTNLALDASIQTLITDIVTLTADLVSLYTSQVKTIGANTNVSIGAAHAESGAITATRVRLCATSACYVLFGATPVADNTALLLAPNVPEVFTFTSGQKVSVLRVSADGVLSITVV